MALGLYWATASFFALVFVFYLDRMGLFTTKNKLSVQGRTFLVTGGSQGLGKALGQLLASRGANVIIVARNTEQLEAALKDIEASAANTSTQRFHYISADLTIPTEASRVFVESAKWNNSAAPDHVLSVAGASHPSYFVETPVSILKSQVDTNYMMGAYTAHAACQAWLSQTQEKGHSPQNPQEPHHIAFVSTVAALVAITGYAPYAPAKAALSHLSDMLSQELLLYESHTPIRTHCIYSGTIDSPGLKRENETKPGVTLKLEEDDGVQSPEEVARLVLEALENGEENITTTGFIGHALRVGVQGCKKRNGWGIMDTLLSWAMSIVLIFVRRDLDGKVRAWGKEKKLGQAKETR